MTLFTYFNFFSGYVHMQNKNDESKRALKCHFESLKWSREDRSFKKLDWNLDFFECRYFLNLNPYLDTVVKILAQILPARKSPNIWKKFFGLQAQTVLLTQIAHSSWALLAAPEIINIWGPQSHFYLHTKFCVFRGHDGKIRII